MKFADVENIWTVDLEQLSRRDQGRIFYERAKVAVAEALTNPKLRREAVVNGRFSRNYLVAEVGCGAAATTQNPGIKELLKNTDNELAGERRSTRRATAPRMPGEESAEVEELKKRLGAAEKRVEVQDAEIRDLRRKLREANWIDTELPDHGRLPW